MRNGEIIMRGEGSDYCYYCGKLKPLIDLHLTPGWGRLICDLCEDSLRTDTTDTQYGGDDEDDGDTVSEV